MSTWVVLTWASSPGSPLCVPGVCMGRAGRAKGNEWEEGAWSFYLTLMWKSGTQSPNISSFLHLPSALPLDFGAHTVAPPSHPSLPASPELSQPGLSRGITVSPVVSRLGGWSGVGGAGTGPKPCRQTHPPGCGTLEELAFPFTVLIWQIKTTMIPAQKLPWKPAPFVVWQSDFNRDFQKHNCPLFREAYSGGQDTLGERKTLVWTSLSVWKSGQSPASSWYLKLSVHFP